MENISSQSQSSPRSVDSHAMLDDYRFSITEENMSSINIAQRNLMSLLETQSVQDCGSPVTSARSMSGRFLRDRPRGRVLPERTSQKRQTLQAMSRPLKHWLYRHRDNPYPNKTDKLELAAGSNMTLTQVNNWFANARRRLKSTVDSPDMTWSTRVRMYNTCVAGNAELFSDSESSFGDSDTESHEVEGRAFGMREEPDVRADQYSLLRRCLRDEPAPPTSVLSSDAMADEYGSHQKYKHSILQRYLNDSLSHAIPLRTDTDVLDRMRHRRQSGSMGSRDYEEMSTSSATSSRFMDDWLDEPMDVTPPRRHRGSDDSSGEADLHWKEYHAALALTTLARSGNT